jgi:cytochrome c biogenesis protein
MNAGIRKKGIEMSWNMRLLKNLASLRLTVGLLLWLAFLCILGTIIPQQPVPSAAGAPFAMHVIMLLSMRDVFHSLWFLIPTAALCLNALACMYLWRKAFGGSSSMPKALLYEVTIPGEGRQDQIRADLTSFMKGTHNRTTHYQEGHREIVMGEKGRPRKFAPFIVHGSILLILIGAGLGYLGYKGSLEVPVGQASDTVMLSNGKIMHLPFKVRCDGFKMELYDNGMPKEYRSEIAFLQGDSVARHASVLVNHPVSFSRVLFSQGGYNQSLVAAIKLSTPAGNGQINAAEGAVIELHDTGYKAHVVKVVEDIMHMGPGVQLVIETPKGEQEVWIFKQIEQIQAMHPGIMEKMPQFNPSRVRPYTFSLGGVIGSYTTILGINYDPGVIFVGLGSVLFMAGICIAFMVVHERVWISLENVSPGLTIRVAQRSNGRPAAISGRIMEHLSSLTGVKS